MSNYINVLRRLERERRIPDVAPTLPSEATTVQTTRAPAPLPIAPAVRDVPSAPPVPRTVIPLPTATPDPAPIAPVPAVTLAPARVVATAAPALPVATPHVDARRAHARAADLHPGIATLLDNIRMLSAQRPSRIVVFSGASTAEPVAALAAQLAAHADERGMRSVVGALNRTATGTVVALQHWSVDDPAALRIDLDAGPSVDDLYAWGQRIAPGNDLIVLTGPPLASSIDSALLACASDGLVIVAESEVTDRAALHTAAERARIAGCRTLGVVMHGTKNRMPGWIRRLMGNSESSRED